MGGCGTKAARPVRGRGGSIQRQNSLRATETVESDPEQMQQIIEERRLRLEMEQQQEREFNEMLYAEKERLRVLSLVMIEKRLSCESLMDELNEEELENLRQHEASYKIQKQLKLKRNRSKSNKRHTWTVSNDIVYCLIRNIQCSSVQVIAAS